MFAEPSQPFGTCYLRMPYARRFHSFSWEKTSLQHSATISADGNKSPEVSNKLMKHCLLLRYSSVGCRFPNVLY